MGALTRCSLQWQFLPVWRLWLVEPWLRSSWPVLLILMQQALQHEHQMLPEQLLGEGA